MFMTIWVETISNVWDWLRVLLRGHCRSSISKATVLPVKGLHQPLFLQGGQPSLLVPQQWNVSLRTSHAHNSSLVWHSELLQHTSHICPLVATMKSIWSCGPMHSTFCVRLSLSLCLSLCVCASCKSVLFIFSLHVGYWFFFGHLLWVRNA